MKTCHYNLSHPVVVLYSYWLFYSTNSTQPEEIHFTKQNCKSSFLRSELLAFLLKKNTEMINQLIKIAPS